MALVDWRQTGHWGAMSLDQPSDFVKHQSVTHDAFLGGRLIVSQPERGFRAGLDSVLLGAAVGEGAGSVLDLGCGVGTAALVAMAHDPGLKATLCDKHAGFLSLAKDNVARNGFDARATILEVDVIARGSERRAAGLAENAFETVIANPPFFDEAAGTLAPESGRASARHMDAATLDLWVKTAATHAAAGGETIFVYPVESLSPLLASFSQRFGGLTVLPLSPRSDAVVTRVLVRGIKGSRAPLRMLASRALHVAEGRDFAPDFDAIFRGQARLDW